MSTHPQHAQDPRRRPGPRAPDQRHGPHGATLQLGIGTIPDIVAGFVMGTRRLYDFVENNPMISLPGVDHVNDSAVILRNPRVTAINSASKGASRIVAMLKPGAGVVTKRANVHCVVTEYGVASLYGWNLRQRARALIDIVNPNHRAALAEEAGPTLRL